MARSYIQFGWPIDGAQLALASRKPLADTTITSYDTLWFKNRAARLRDSRRMATFIALIDSRFRPDFELP